MKESVLFETTFTISLLVHFQVESLCSSVQRIGKSVHHNSHSHASTWIVVAIEEIHTASLLDTLFFQKYCVYLLIAMNYN